jgi:hypothetical protein
LKWLYVRFVADSLLEGAVQGELVSESEIFRGSDSSEIPGDFGIVIGFRARKS